MFITLYTSKHSKSRALAENKFVSEVLGSNKTMAATSSSSPAASPSPATGPTAAELINQIRSHEIALAEINNLPSSRAIYQKNGNLYFRTTVQQATAAEQRQLDSAKAKLQNLNSP